MITRVNTRFNTPSGNNDLEAILGALKNAGSTFGQIAGDIKSANAQKAADAGASRAMNTVNAPRAALVRAPSGAASIPGVDASGSAPWTGKAADVAELGKAYQIEKMRQAILPDTPDPMAARIKDLQMQKLQNEVNNHGQLTEYQKAMIAQHGGTAEETLRHNRAIEANAQLPYNAPTAYQKALIDQHGGTSAEQVRHNKATEANAAANQERLSNPPVKPPKPLTPDVMAKQAIGIFQANGWSDSEVKQALGANEKAWVQTPDGSAWYLPGQIYDPNAKGKDQSKTIPNADFQKLKTLRASAMAGAPAVAPASSPVAAAAAPEVDPADEYLNEDDEGS